MKPTPKQIIKELRARNKRQEDMFKEKDAYNLTLATDAQQLRARISQMIEASQKREQQNVTNLTNGLVALINAITGRRVKNINWSWE